MWLSASLKALYKGGVVLSDACALCISATVFPHKIVCCKGVINASAAEFNWWEWFYANLKEIQ